MREVQIVRWCDICWLEGEGDEHSYVPAVTAWTVAIAIGEATKTPVKVLDVCEAHSKPLEDLAGLLTEVGQSPEQIKAPPKQQTPMITASPRPMTQCPVCRRMIGANTLVNHIWTNHRNDKQPEQPKVCPECSKAYPTGQGMSSHRRLAHDFDAVQFALSGVKNFKAAKAITTRRAKNAAAEETQVELPMTESA